MFLFLLKSGINCSFNNGNFFHKPKTCLGMCGTLKKLAVYINKGSAITAILKYGNAVRSTCLMYNFVNRPLLFTLTLQV